MNQKNVGNERFIEPIAIVKPSKQERQINIELTVNKQNIESDKIRESSLDYPQLANQAYLHCIPPNIEECENHRRATMIGKPTRSQVKIIDPISGYTVNNELLPINVDPIEFAHMGPSYVLFFQFIWFCIIIMLTIFLIMGVYIQYGDLNDDCPIPTKNINIYNLIDYSYCTLSLILATYIYWLSPEEAVIKQTLALYCLISIMILIQIFRIFQFRLALKCYKNIVTAADYSFVVENLPKHYSNNIDIALELNKFFTLYGRKDGKINIKKVHLCYDYTEKREIKNKLKSKILEISKLTAQKNNEKLKNQNEIDRIQQKINELQKNINALEIAYSDPKTSKFAGIVIITCNSREEKNSVLKNWQLSTFGKIIEYFKSNSTYKWCDRLLYISQAPKPSEICWDNLRTSRKKMWLCRLFSLIFGIFGILIIFVLNFYLQDFETNAQLAQFPGKRIYLSFPDITHYLTLMIIVIVNYGTRVLIIKLEKLNFHFTWTEYESSLAWKFGIIKFLNTLIIAVTMALYGFANFCKKLKLIQKGYNALILGVDIISILRSNTFLQLVIALIDFEWIIKWCKRIIIKKQAGNFTQEEAIIAFEEPTIELSTEYSNLIITFFIAVLFASYIPISLMWATITFIGIYWIEKVSKIHMTSFQHLLQLKFTRKSSKSPYISIQFGESMLRLMNSCVLIYAFGNSIFCLANFIPNYEDIEYDLEMAVEAETLQSGVFIYALIYLILPFGKIIKLFLKLPPEGLLEQTYEEIKFSLEDDYDRQNPATKEKAIKEFCNAHKQ